MNIVLYQNDLPDDLPTIEGDLAIDTETMGLSLCRNDRLCLLQLCSGHNDVYLINFTERNYNAPNLKKLLLDQSRVKIFHYARFDLAIIKKYLGIELENIFCTKIASKLTRTYTDYHGLKELCRDLLSVPISKQQQSSYWGKKDLTLEQKEYAAKDVFYLHKIRDRLQEMLLSENRLDIAKQIFQFLPVRVNLDLMGWNDIDIFMH